MNHPFFIELFSNASKPVTALVLIFFAGGIEAVIAALNRPDGRKTEEFRAKAI